MVLNSTFSVKPSSFARCLVLRRTVHRVSKVLITRFCVVSNVRGNVCRSYRAVTLSWRASIALGNGTIDRTICREIQSS
jgi:hypothetical protein